MLLKKSAKSTPAPAQEDKASADKDTTQESTPDSSADESAKSSDKN